MVNAHCGEIEADLDGKRCRLCLTLGALSELEQVFGEKDMLAVAMRFEAGRIKASDAIKMLGAGLRGRRLRDRRYGCRFHARGRRRGGGRRYYSALVGGHLHGAH